MTKRSMLLLLEEYGGRPLQSLSQNFLIDENIAEKIASSALTKSSSVVEIGAGLGALTEFLNDSYPDVHVFEIDDLYAQILSDRFPKIFVHHLDFLDSGDILSKFSQPYVVIANIPYHITSQLIRFCLTMPHPPVEFVFLMQKEVAKRIVDQEKPSILQLAIALYAEAKYMFTVPKTCFFPQPKVDSAVVRFTRLKTPLHPDAEGLIGFLKGPFGQRRKVLVSTLQRQYSEIEWDKVFLRHSLHPLARPEDLTLDSWILLYNEYKQKC
jgi:16S rRNA (adenine1518-N6/adenine1519-N6)-dimethyltransferase